MEKITLLCVMLCLLPATFASVPSKYEYLNQVEYETNSTHTACDYPVSISSILLGTCEYVSPGYQTTVCTGSYVQVYNCSDSACNQCALLAQTPTNQCSPSTAYSLMYTCTNTIPKLNANQVVTYETFSDNSCSGQIVQSTSIMTNYCFGKEEYQEYSCNAATGQVVQYTCTDPQCSQNCVKNNYNMNCLPLSGGSVTVFCS
mmetsp:Transcript_8138/g.11205  ORF Transcript_8138/g.11205 Transcript_8138/m.11205 type:complete len:202 (-) Transcript_8138:68-673(-)